MKRGILAVSVVLGLVLYANRSVVHEVVVDTVLAMAGLAGLCLVSAVGLQMFRHRPVGQVRYRVQPEQLAVVVRQRAGRPVGPRCQACGQPASRTFGEWPVCDDCGGRLDRADREAAGQPDYPAKTAGLAAAYGYQPAEDVPAMLRPSDGLPEGETVGELDMTEFEKRLSS